MAMGKRVRRKYITPSQTTGHPFENQVFFLDYILAVVDGTMVERAGDDGGQTCSLLHREFRGRFVKISLTCDPHAKHTGPHSKSTAEGGMKAHWFKPRVHPRQTAVTPNPTCADSVPPTANQSLSLPHRALPVPSCPFASRPPPAGGGMTRFRRVGVACKPLLSNELVVLGMAADPKP